MSAAYRVLIAEDETVFGMTVARHLQNHGHAAKICTTGKAVERSLTDAEWDVLLLDLRLPDADGLQILAKVRESYAE
jgi:DNA-binding response OmpR family regulator